MKRLAVLGHPVAHSRSPAMQTAALEATGLGGEWSYGAIDVGPQEFPAKVAELARNGYVGANVTIPHKEAALLLASEASAQAKAIGAANTLSFDGERVLAENTDASGIAAALRDAARPSSTPGQALVVGAGGSARAAAWALREAGHEVSIWNRTSERAAQVARELDLIAAEAEPDLSRFDVIVNATPVDLGDGEGPETDQPGSPDALKGFPIRADVLNDRQVVVDLAYGALETPVIAAAKAADAKWIDGLEVLVCQGAESFRIWTGIDPPLDVMRRAARAGSPDDSHERAPHPSPGAPDTGS